MNARFLSLLIGGVGLSTIIAIGYVNLIAEPIAPQNPEILTHQELIEQAQKIAVRIRTEKTSGSGIIIDKTNYTYTIITNRHVVARGDKYHIQTPDNNIHIGTLIVVSQQEDLAILQFTSDFIYETATINYEPLPLGISLFAAGFPFNSERLQVTSGKLSLQAIKPLKKGYQIGYTNTIYQGMSGGAILNSVGEVVGVNGRSASPIIPDYQYQDTTYPSEKLQQQMRQLSWGIPIVKAIELSSTIENN